MRNNSHFKEDLRISYLDLLIKHNYQEEFNENYDEGLITELISTKTSKETLEKIKSIITFRKGMLENAMVQKEGIRR